MRERAKQKKSEKYVTERLYYSGAILFNTSTTSRTN